MNQPKFTPPQFSVLTKHDPTNDPEINNGPDWGLNEYDLPSTDPVNQIK